jgi:hypothetical protein
MSGRRYDTLKRLHFHLSRLIQTPTFLLNAYKMCENCLRSILNVIVLNINLSLILKYVSRHVDVWINGGIAPRIVNLGRLIYRGEWLSSHPGSSNPEERISLPIGQRLDEPQILS